MKLTTETAQPHSAREAMVARLEGRLVSPAVLAALRTVPREAFVPEGTPLEETYAPDRPVVTRRDEHGADTSSVSAPSLQGRMIELAQIGPGARMLEIGSGGYNAALLAEVVGEAGSVVSIDIDPWVTARAVECLAATGYSEQVTVLTGDGELPVEGHGPFDAILVTVGAWDIAPAWLDQLVEGGRLVVPLRMRSVTRTLALRWAGNHLVSEGAETGGFVPMQGIGGHDEHALHLPDPDGGHLTLRFDDEVPARPHLLDGVLATPPVEVWSGLPLSHGQDFSGLHLWFASFLDGFCRINADPGSELAGLQAQTWFPFGTAAGDSFAHLAIRPLAEGGGVEFGARAWGPHAIEAAERLNAQIEAWDKAGRPDHAEIAYWPEGADLTAAPGAAHLRKAHGVLTISWPLES
ncbi:methyltransferase, FxLD system [Promicromonospora sp. NPDC090134]|uniref:methyltransferase, FxLD system n=1 Tax=Promicromonospora sp. NPDC090134 TaxID=3364408 RepID=UPI003809AB81